MRMVRLAARLFSSAGSTRALNWSNGLVSRKKNDSFVVIASTTSRITASSILVRMTRTRSSKVASFHLRATGNSRLSRR